MKPRYYTGASYRSQYSSAEQDTYELRMPNACEVVKNKEVHAVYAGTRKRPKYKIAQTSEILPWIEPFTNPETQILSDKIAIVGQFIYGDNTEYVLYADSTEQLLYYPAVFDLNYSTSVSIYYGSQVPVYAYADLGEPYLGIQRITFGMYGAVFTTFNNLFSYSMSTSFNNWTWPLTKIDLSRTRITKIGYQMFYGLTSLVDVKLPDGITAIGYAAFSLGSRRNDNLHEMIIPDTVEYIGERAFEGRTIYNYTFHEGLREIGRYAFYNGNGFTTVEIPSTIETIGENAFYGAFSTTATERILRIHKTEAEAPAGAPWGATNATIIYDE